MGDCDHWEGSRAFGEVRVEFVWLELDRQLRFIFRAETSESFAQSSSCALLDLLVCRGTGRSYCPSFSMREVQEPPCYSVELYRIWMRVWFS